LAASSLRSPTCAIDLGGLGFDLELEIIVGLLDGRGFPSERYDSGLHLNECFVGDFTQAVLGGFQAGLALGEIVFLGRGFRDSPLVSGFVLEGDEGRKGEDDGGENPENVGHGFELWGVEFRVGKH
jgi:hypothetical protein